ncbi:unnamed protein product, partial [Aphanomyces euteiches]
MAEEQRRQLPRLLSLEELNDNYSQSVTNYGQAVNALEALQEAEEEFNQTSHVADQAQKNLNDECKLQLWRRVSAVP